MSKLILFEDAAYRNFLPLTYWRPVFRLRCGRYPLMDRALSRMEHHSVALWVRQEIEAVARSRYAFEINTSAEAGSLLINGRWMLPGHPKIAAAPCVGMIGDEIAFILCDEPLAGQLSSQVMLDSDQLRERLQSIPKVQADGAMFNYPWDLIVHNGEMLRQDWRGSDRLSVGKVHERACVLNAQRVHIGKGTVIKPGAVIDAEEGPVYIGDNVTIMPNAVIEGPTYVGDDSVINAGAWIRTNVSIGPGCKVGGEVGASIVHAFSNKQHDGFLGHSYLAEWVNIGAGTVTSNLKNTFGEIKVPINGQPVSTGQTFIGSIIGDFAKTGINQTLTTGSVIGLGSSIATSTINPQFVPSFRFMTDQKDEAYDVKRGLDVAVMAMARRNVDMSNEEKAYFDRLPRICANAESV